MIKEQFVMAEWLEQIYNIHSVNKLIKEQYLMAEW